MNVKLFYAKNPPNLTICSYCYINGFARAMKDINKDQYRVIVGSANFRAFKVSRQSEKGIP